MSRRHCTLEPKENFIRFFKKQLEMPTQVAHGDQPELLDLQEMLTLQEDFQIQKSVASGQVVRMT